MTCDQTQPLLEASADCELGWGTAWRVRHHLAACPACTEEFAEIRQFERRVRAWRDVAAPAGLQSRIAAALPSRPPVSAPRRPVTARRVAVGLAGMAAAGAAFFWLTPGQPGRPTIAFADVEQAMQQVQTVRWETSFGFTDASGRGYKSGGSNVTWVRRSLPAIATIGSPRGWKKLKDERGELIRSAQGNFLTRPLTTNGGRRNIENEVRSQLQDLTQPPAEQSTDTSHAVYDIVTNPQQSLKTLNGQKRILFTRDIETVIRRGRIVPEIHYFSQYSAWVDPATRLVVRTVSHNWGDKMSGQYNRRQIVVRDFHYNESPPPGVFDWSPPAGAKVEGHW